MSRHGIARRIAALESALAPAPVHHWSPWQELLFPEEDALLRALAAHPGRFALGLEAHGALCADERERDLFAAIAAKADAPFGPP